MYKAMSYSRVIALEVLKVIEGHWAAALDKALGEVDNEDFAEVDAVLLPEGDGVGLRIKP